MKVVHISIFVIGIGLVIVSLSLRKQGRRNWVGLMAGGIAILVLGVVSAVFGLSL